MGYSASRETVLALQETELAYIHSSGEEPYLLQLQMPYVLLLPICSSFHLSII